MRQQPLPVQAPFFEQFTDDWNKRWKVSRAKKVNDKTSNEEWAYIGQWAVEEPTVLKGIDGDKGLGTARFQVFVCYFQMRLTSM